MTHLPGHPRCCRAVSSDTHFLCSHCSLAPMTICPWCIYFLFLKLDTKFPEGRSQVPCRLLFTLCIFRTLPAYPVGFYVLGKGTAVCSVTLVPLNSRDGEAECQVSSPNTHCRSPCALSALRKTQLSRS